MINDNINVTELCHEHSWHGFRYINNVRTRCALNA